MTGGDRHARQKLLPEIGPGGQARIESTPFALAPGTSREIEEAARLYAHAAGFAVVPPGSPGAAAGSSGAQATFAHRAFFRHPSALRLAEGAHLVLTRLHEALEITPARQDGSPRSTDRPHR